VRNDGRAADVGSKSGWAAGDDDGNGIEPINYRPDTPDDRFRDILTWLFLPALVAAISIGAWFHSWFNLPTWYGWAFAGVALVIYMVIGWRGGRLFLYVSRLVRRNT
jgi:hypothetical protein